MNKTRLNWNILLQMYHNHKDGVILSETCKRTLDILNSIFSLASNKLYMVFLAWSPHKVHVLNSVLKASLINVSEVHRC